MMIITFVTRKYGLNIQDEDSEYSIEQELMNMLLVQHRIYSVLL